MPPGTDRGFIIWFFQPSLALSAFLLGALAASAADWPQFGGPNRNGHWDETGILETFPGKGVKINWRRPVGGGFSSPVVANGRAFVIDVALSKPASRERVHCFDEKTGKVLWVFGYKE